MKTLLKCAVAVLILLAIVPANVHSAKENNAICRVDCEDKRIALTFDDGPHPVYTKEILDILSDYGVKATFFIIGKNAEKYPYLIIDEISDGHEIGSHTFSHKYLCNLSVSEMNYQLEHNETVLSSICDYRFKLLRPPGGIISDRLNNLCDRYSYKMILWSVDTRDWTIPDPARVVDTVERNVKSGDVILMHDYVCATHSSTPEALRSIIPDLLGKGFRFVTVSELIGIDE